MILLSKTDGVKRIPGQTFSCQSSPQSAQTPPPSLSLTSLFLATGGDPLKGQTNTTQPKGTGPLEVQHQFQNKTKTTSQQEEREYKMFSNI